MGNRHPQSSPAPNALIAIKILLEKTAPLTGKSFFRELVKSLAELLAVHGVWIAVPNEDFTHLDALAFWLGDDFVESYYYQIAGTPCEMVFESGTIFHVPSRVVELFPKDPDLKPLHAVSYVGIALQNKRGNIMGHLAVLDNKPMPELPDFFALLNIFAARAAAELERVQYENRLAENESKLSQLVDHAFDGILEFGEGLQVRMSNPAARKLFDPAGRSLEGRKLSELLTDAGMEKLKRTVQLLSQRTREDTAHWLPGHLEGMTSSGDHFLAEATVSRFQSRGAIYNILFLRNVQDRLRAEERIRALSREVDIWRREARELAEGTNIIGESVPIRQALQTIAQIADTDTTVLIEGETGTGKELFARAIHQSSGRRDRPLVAVNCAALPEALMESEFFGHVKGAFTGAQADREGLFALAHRSTLFLDEVGELPLTLQAKLLRALQEGEIQPVGSTRIVKVDVRIIAATNRDLRCEVEAGRFREDLYYRLHVLPISVPPLRERGDDILLLARAFAARYAKKYHRRIEPLSKACSHRLLTYSWPGNVRELQNVMERAVITAREGRMDILNILAPTTEGDDRPTHPEAVLTVDQIRQLEMENIRKALRLTAGRVSGKDGAAALLGMPPTTLASRIKTLGIKI